MKVFTNIDHNYKEVSCVSELTLANSTGEQVYLNVGGTQDDGALMLSNQGDYAHIAIQAGSYRNTVARFGYDGVVYIGNETGDKIYLDGGLYNQDDYLFYNEGNLLEATQSAKGLLSAADKTKLDGIAEGANKYILPAATSTVLGGVKVDTALSTTSTNPVQNKVVNSALARKLDMFTSAGVASSSGDGAYLYFKFATIKITNAYQNYPIVFEMSGRGRGFSIVTVRFANSAGSDPSLEAFTSDNDSNFYIVKSATSTWDLYGIYNETYGDYVIHRVTGAGAYLDVTVAMSNVSAIPDGSTQVTYGGSAAYAIKASQDASGNTIASTYSKLGHTHTKSQITDFPSSMPASDVYAWAKAATKPSYTASEVGALSLSGGTLTSSNREVLAINSTAALGPILRLDLNGTNVASMGCIPQSYSNGYGTFINNTDGDTGIVIGVDGKLYRHASVDNLYPRYEILDASNYNSYSPTLTGTGASGTWAIGISGNAASATKLATARTISLTGAMSASASFNGTADATLNVSSVDAAFVTIDGTSSASGYTTIIDSMGDNSRFGNRAALCYAAGVTIENSTDGGTTWADYGATDAQKIALLCDVGNPLILGNPASSLTQTRVTLNGGSMGICCNLKRIAIFVTRLDATNARVQVERKSSGSWTTTGTYPLSGWPGWNSFPLNGGFGGAITDIRLTFMLDAVSSSYPVGLYINKIFLLGAELYSYKSAMALTGHLYNYDTSGNASFPANVTAVKHINRQYNSSSYFLMGDGSVTTKKNLTSSTHCGWSDATTDGGLVPTMNTIAFWNGAYASSGASNLTYCCKGAFGDFAARSSLAFSELTSKPTTLAGYGITDGMAKQGIFTGNIDTLYTTGCAYLGESCSGTFPASGMNFAYGEMLVMSNADTVGQIFVPYAISSYYGYGLYYRGGNTSSKAWNYSWRMCLDNVNYSSYALPLTGGTLTGALTLRGLDTPIVRDFSYNTGSYARSLIDIEQDGSTRLGSIGYMGYAGNNFGYFYIGNKDFDGYNLRVYSDKVTWGDSTIYHSGNSNLSTVDWNCYQLNVNANQFYNAETAYVFYSSGRSGFYVAGSPYGLYVATHDSTNNATGNRIIIPPSGTISVYDSVSITGTCYASTGIYTAGYVSARGQDTSSDISLKKDLKPIDNALDYVLGTRYWRFKWKDSGEDCIGIIAQEEREREYGFLVRKHSDKYTYDYAASTALLGAALQEEDNKVERLRLRIEQLENEIKNLRYGN